MPTSNSRTKRLGRQPVRGKEQRLQGIKSLEQGEVVRARTQGQDSVDHRVRHPSHTTNVSKK